MSNVIFVSFFPILKVEILREIDRILTSSLPSSRANNQLGHEDRVDDGSVQSQFPSDECGEGGHHD